MCRKGNIDMTNGILLRLDGISARLQHPAFHRRSSLELRLGLLLAWPVYLGYGWPNYDQSPYYMSEVFE